MEKDNMERKTEWFQDCITSGRYELLRGRTFCKKRYQTKSDRWDHDHCEFCWAKFTEDIDGTEHEGFTTTDRYYWICDECFELFKNHFGFQLEVDTGIV